MPQKTILVTGDQSPDFDIYLQSTENNPKPGALPTVVRPSIGGAGIACRILQAAAKVAGSSDNPINIDFLQYQQAAPHYVTAVWVPKEPGKLFTSPGKKEVWRTLRTLSLGEVNMTEQVLDTQKLYEGMAGKSADTPDVLLLEDDGAGFRYKPSGRVTELLSETSETLPEWIVFKTCAPVCHGTIWSTVSGSKDIADRLVVVVPILDLRKISAVKLSYGISWERTVEDLIRELTTSPELAGLRKAKHLIVTLHGEGALWMHRQDDDTFSFTLIFDPAHMETEWSAAIKADGDSYGYHACFASAIALHCARASSMDNLPESIKNGIKAMRVMRLMGHGFTKNTNVDKETLPGLPLDVLGNILISDEKSVPNDLSRDIKWDEVDSFGVVEIPRDELNEPKWRILEVTENRFLRKLENNNEAPIPLHGIARRVAVHGVKALENIPYARFRNLFTADRDEIESLRNFKLLIERYQKNEKETKPLSLAVFGPPGAGKSFGVKQIAKEVFDKDVHILEFNLSQFDDPNDLIGAFHQVRDIALKGLMPVVFWDEFDSKKYDWLQYLLAPMQDGQFQEGQLTHPIGRSVFVFAGATSYTFKNFGPLPSADKEDKEDYVLKKGPDFISRLHGTLDVLGPNPRQVLVRETEEHDGNKVNVYRWKDDQTDICYPVRRAILLRALLGLMSEKTGRKRLDIDHGLLVALLEIGHYRYGSRSFEKIVSSLNAGDPTEITRSGLPSNETLAVAIEESLYEFNALMDEFKPFQAYADKIAPYIHEFYREQAKIEGWTPKYNDPYDELPLPVKQDNIAAALRIPWILGLNGLILEESKSWDTKEKENITNILKDNIDIGAEEEHTLWMKDKQQNGWQYSETRDDDNLKHDCLLLYDNLPEKQKAKDRDSVENFPKIAQLAGFKIKIHDRK